jgi:hypothetical protein
MNKPRIIVFSVFALLGIVFGVVRISQNISITNSVSSNERKQSENTASREFDEAKLRVIDTDGDGLLDWDELNIHGTSPYLIDSDSDTIEDNVEISQGTDPNCPEGRTCGSDIINILEELQKEAAEVAAQEQAQEPFVSGYSSKSQQALNALESGQTPTADEIRALLQDSGIAKEQLAQTPDEDLIQLFQEVAQDTQ